jgi:hypothetical protein
MNMRYFPLFLTLYFLLHTSVSAQYPRFIFRNPLGIPMHLIANFGEVRSDHYHMGLDLRTQQKENLPVYAAAEGYVSRITIEAGGYGNCVYITHPNGYTTLYAHLNKFFPALQDFVERKQYHDEKWEQDIRFPKSQFNVAKGQFIAFSGATGSVEGPHLHFEVRDTKTGNNINPLFLGFPIKDELQPSIYKFFLYDRNYSTYEIDPIEIKIKGRKGVYETKDSVIETGSGKISFGIGAEDIANGTGFRFGIYSAELWMDSLLQYSFKLKEFNYDQSRYVNASVDYKKWATGKDVVQHLSRLPGNRLDVHEGENDGVIVLKDTLPHNCFVILTDVTGNESVLNFVLRWEPGIYEQRFFAQDRVTFLPNRKNELIAEGLSIQFPENAFYDTVRFFSGATLVNENALSPIYQVHYPFVPLHEDYRISIKPLQAGNPEKTLMVLKGKGYYVTKPEFKNAVFTAEFNQFGAVSLIEDTTAPIISPVDWPDGAVFGKKGSISIQVKDDVSYIKNFRAELDSNWLMLSRKGNIYAYRFDDYCSIGKHQLKIIVTDLAGNETIRTFNFELKEKLPVRKTKKKSSKKKHGNSSKRRR